MLWEAVRRREQERGGGEEKERGQTVNLDHERLDNIVSDQLEVGVTDPVRNLTQSVNPDSTQKSVCLFSVEEEQRALTPP